MEFLSELASWSLDWLAQGLPQMTPLEQEAVRLSVWIALWCTIVVLPLAAATAFLLARREFPGKTVLDVVVHLPLVVPPVLTGYLLLLAFGRNGWIGYWLYEGFGVSFAFQWTGAVIAAAVMAFPLAVRAIRLSLESVDPNLETSAASLGASKAQILWRVTLPLCAPGIVAAAILAFARSLGEFGATITFVSNIPGETRTIANALYALMQTPGTDDQVMRLAAISLALAFAALLISEALSARGRRRSAGGRARGLPSGWRL